MNHADEFGHPATRGHCARSRWWKWWVASVLALFAAVPSTQPAGASVGRTTAVVQQARGTPPAQSTRVLTPKLDLFQNEHIQTDGEGVTQILFNDGSNLTVGPNSDLFIDRFVYDPDTSTGELAAKLGRGVLRFVGGQISKRGSAAVTTPVAVIGVRGGIAVLEHDDAGNTSAVLLFGDEVTVSGVGVGAPTKRISRPGFSVTVGADGGVSVPVRLPAEKLDRVLASLEGNEDSDGGATERPTRESTENSEYANTSDPGSPPEGVDVGDAAGRLNAEVQRGSRSPGALWRYRRGVADVNLGLPFLESVRGAQSPLTIIKREGSFPDAMSTGGYPFLRATTLFDGQGADQVGGVFVYLGTVIPNSRSTPSRLLGRTVGSARNSGSSGSLGAYHTWGIIDENPEEHSTPPFDRATPPATFHTASGAYDSAGAHRPQFTRTEAHLDRETSRSRLELQWVLESSVPLEAAGPRGDRNWHGYATALFEVRTSGVRGHEFGGTYSMRNRTGSPGDVTLAARAESGRLGALFALGQVADHELDPGDTTNASRNYPVTDMEISFGRRPSQPVPDAIERVSPTRGTYVSDEAFGALSSVGSDASGATHRLILVNGELVPSRNVVSRTWMVNNDPAPVEALLPPGVAYCDCPAAKFGWWGGRIGLFTGANEERVDSVFPGTFVVGELPEIADIPSEGTASYSGHAAAAIRNEGIAYTAVGGFNLEWDFATRGGEARITNLDGRDYTASDLVAPLANPRDFSGQLTQNGGSVAGPVAGSFFSDGASPVRDTGGQFRMQSGSYTAVGSFAATR